MKQSSQNPSFGQGLELANIANKAIVNTIKKNKVTAEEVQRVIGKPGQVFELFDKLFAKDQLEKNDSILSLLSTPETLVLEELDGKATLAEAKSTFKSYVDSDFRNWGLNDKGNGSKEMPVQVYEMVKDATYSQMFNSLPSDLDSLCLTQNQIIRFCEKHPSHLRQDGYITLFLFKESAEYFVTRVAVGSGGLGVGLDRFGSTVVWSAEFRYRLIVPQLNN
ncbi:MAG: hypothetical protein ACLFNO_02435 [Parcubacteria group bacterium]